ncbi:MAG: hypothetical protein E7462_01555 [Ruminococcaceae bacterium]|nr:hypothetical protein [Oscillospiraceae bacterium]
MSEPQLISPLLDGFVMGDPISNHDGVQSCPAMHLESEQKYIVKIISVPASQSKMDALLLAGAFTDRESALTYFKDLADGVTEEAELLQKLSRFEGFVSFENWQNVPMENDDTGFDIYLLSAYRPTLDGVLRANEMTHLGAINLGLDLCAALSVSRRFGYLYANLQPSNIYICNEREFRIGDLGFLSLSSLPYASLPDKYHSKYTPPEICDAYSALNETMDTYAVGLILYQAFNDGQLPPAGIALEAPRHADPQLSQIIMKACAMDPEERWQDPVQMGQALAGYLQTNTVNDTPIAPLPVNEDEPEEVEEITQEDTQPTTEDILAEVDEALEVAPPLIPTVSSEETEETPQEEAAVEEAPVAEEPVVSESDADAQDEIVSPDTPEEAAPEETSEEPAVAEESAEAEESDETQEILAQADDLIAHQLPDPVVAPEPIEVTLPVVEADAPEEENPDEDAPEEPVADAAAEETAIAEEAPEDGGTDEEEPASLPQKTKKRLIRYIIAASILILLIVGGILFYQHYYLQTVHDITLSGSEDRLTVTLTTTIADEKLTVRCVDTHGNPLTQQVVDGVATFEGLKPGTSYKIEVRISGFHQLVGKTSEDYTTAAPTTISGFYAATGHEEGSVILSFNVQYPSNVNKTQWTVSYSAEGEEEKSVTFNDHIVTINGLTLGKEYTFRLKPVHELYLSGTDTITYVPGKLIYAEDLQIVELSNQQLTVSWVTPESVNVPKWLIRCYSEQAGYDKTLHTQDNTITFDGIDSSFGYSVEVIAEGMTLGIRTYLSANAIQITNVETDVSNLNHLSVKWSFNGKAPADGWLLLYTIDDSTEQQVITCTGPQGVITPLIPGAKYQISIQVTDGTTAFGGDLEFTAPAPTIFNGYGVEAEDIDFSMCETPGVSNWDRYDVKKYTTSFAPGKSASFVMHLTKSTTEKKDNVVTLYVIRDAEGKIVSSKYESRTWDDMWLNRYGKLTIPVMPEEAGEYTVSVYFNGAAVTKQSFEIVA